MPAGKRAKGMSLPPDWQPQVSLAFCTAPCGASRAAAAAEGAKADKAPKAKQGRGGKRPRKAKEPAADGAGRGGSR